jgi:hypothetical protein
MEVTAMVAQQDIGRPWFAAAEDEARRIRRLEERIAQLEERGGQLEHALEETEGRRQLSAAEADRLYGRWTEAELRLQHALSTVADGLVLVAWMRALLEGRPAGDTTASWRDAADELLEVGPRRAVSLDGAPPAAAAVDLVLVPSGAEWCAAVAELPDVSASDPVPAVALGHVVRQTVELIARVLVEPHRNPTDTREWAQSIVRGIVSESARRAGGLR